MDSKKVDLYLWIGVVCNLLLAGFFIYLYFSSLPVSSDLTDYGNKEIAGLSIYNEKLDKVLSQLKKTENLPINVDPNEIGKDNPYGN